MRAFTAPAAVLIAAVAAISAGCASAGTPHPFPMPAAPHPFPMPAAPPARSSGYTPPADAPAVIATALSLRGVPYRNGGGDPHGFDCSGFTQYVFARNGVALPREVRDQFAAGTAVGREEDVRAGDLLFFTTTDPGASHVAIALGGGAFVHAPSSRGVVRVESLETPYWSERYLGARRVTPP